MAKKKSQGASKSQAVHDYLARHPDATASTIRPALAERGIDVSVALVGQVKQRMKKSGELSGTSAPPKKKASKKKRAGNKTARKKSAATHTTSKKLTADDLMDAKKLVDDLGGIDQARKALQYLEELG